MSGILVRQGGQRNPTYCYCHTQPTTTCLLICTKARPIFVSQAANPKVKEGKKMSDSKAIPQRADIEEQHKWNLADLYENDEAWEADYNRVLDLIKSAAKFSGRLAESPKTMYECLHTRSELQIILSRLYQYSFLCKDLDNRVSKYQALTDRAAALSAQAGAAFSFIEPELLAIDETKLRKMADQFPKTDEYDFYIKELIRSKAHIRSEEVEEVLALSSLVTRGPDNIFSMLDDADIKYPSVKDEDGNEVQLTKQRVVKLLESADPRVRKDAHAAFYSVYREHTNTLGASLASSVNTDLFYIKTRRYNSCLESALDGDNIPLDVYHSLIETTEKNLDGLHTYVELRKRLLKLDKIHSYDMMCPLFPDEDYEVSWDDAVRQTLEATVPLGTEYQKNLKAAFDSRWVDVWETEGKGSGAYNSHTYSAHPFVLMNYNNTVDNMFTLAHEMGHSMHSHLTNHTQPFPKSHYSIFVAEVASTLRSRERRRSLARPDDQAVARYDAEILRPRLHGRWSDAAQVVAGTAFLPFVLCLSVRDLVCRFTGDPGQVPWRR